MMVAPVQSGPAFSVGAPGVLFERSLSYDVTADGREFLMIERQLDLVPNQLSVVLDWGGELRRRVPVRAD